MANRQMLLLTSTLGAASALALLKPQPIKEIWRPGILYLVALSLMLGLTSVALADTFTTIDFPGAAFTLLAGINPRGDEKGADKAQEDNDDQGDGPKFTTIDFPGAISTLLAGINPHGDIVGPYLGMDGKMHGGLLSEGPGGDFISFEVGDGSTCNDCNTVEKSNSRGDIVGNYTIAGVTRGYLLRGGPGGDFTSIDFPGPGVTRTAALGISPHGDIVGNYTVAGAKHGYLLSEGSFTSIDFPGAVPVAGTPPLCPGSCALAINSHGDITGAYTTADGVTHGYLLRRGQFTSFEFPGAIFTNANAINPRGDIVGRYDSPPGHAHGYLLTGGPGGTFTTIDFPGSTFTTANGINPRGDIVGKYKTPDGNFHGYLLSR